MSLKFTMLIILGYIAGITAKLISHSINYVLIVYIINLAIVSVNIAVYFINRKYDMEEEQMKHVTAQTVQDESNIPTQIKQAKLKLSEKNSEEMKKYSRMNKTAQQGATVLFGTDYFKEIDFSEFAEGCTEPFYNRSFTDLKIDCAADAIKSTLREIKPQNLFVNIGEAELNDESFDIEAFIEKYRWLLYTLHRVCDTKIYIVAVISNLPNAQIINQRLKLLSDEVGCEFVNGVRVLAAQNPDFELFRLMYSYVRRSPITFVEAMNH